jgi:hypothetical protein
MMQGQLLATRSLRSLDKHRPAFAQGFGGAQAPTDGRTYIMAQRVYGEALTERQACLYFCHALPIVPDVSGLLEGGPLSSSCQI